MTPQRREVELPNGESFEFFVTPLTALERERAMKAAGDNTSAFSQELILLKCRDENGQALFTKADLVELKRTAASITDALALAVLGTPQEEEEGEAPDPKSRAKRTAA